MELGRFVVDTHVHPQRHAVNFEAQDDDADYTNLAMLMHTAVPADEATDDDKVVVFDNSDRLVYDMDRYGVDMCVLLPAFGMTNEINEMIMEDHPDRFVACAQAQQTKKDALRGEEEWSIDKACEEIDYWLEKDGFRGIGEFLPYDPNQEEPMTWRERKPQLRKVFEVADKHDVPIRWHPGAAAGYSGGGLRKADKFPEYQDPMYAADIIPEFPDVDLIFEHGGVQGHWRYNVERALIVAAQFNNVYLEVGLWWEDLLKRAFNDPNVGPEQLIFGTDWGASMVANANHNSSDTSIDFPPLRWEQYEKRGLPAHQPDYWGTTLREMQKYALFNNLPQDELNLVMGGNFCDLYDVDPPHSRLFPEYLDR